MHDKELLKNLIIWPMISIFVVIIAKYTGQVTWGELLKVLPIFGCTSVLFVAAIFYHIHMLNMNNELRLRHLEDVRVLKSLLKKFPIPSERTGHENLGEPTKSAFIMGAIPKSNADERIKKFASIMARGVGYRFIYLDEPSTRAGLIAYCNSIGKLSTNELKNTLSRVDLKSQFQVKLVPVEAVQLAFDIFDHEAENCRMLIHFPSFGPLSLCRKITNAK